jgi:flagellin
MGLRINTNVASLNALTNTDKRTSAVNTSLEKLGSGERINKAADDAAGLAISEKFKAAIRGYNAAKRSSLDGISMVQTAEGGLNEIGNMLTRLRELSVQAASDTIGPQERTFLNMEYQNLGSEIQRIALATDFNGVSLLQGKAGEFVEGNVEFQVGIKNREAIDRISFKPEETDARIESLGVAGTGVEMKSHAQDSIGKIDDAIMKVSGMRARFGALQNRLQSTINNISTMNENMSSANSRVRDTDVAEVSSQLAKDSILQQASASVLAQANANGHLALKLLS